MRLPPRPTLVVVDVELVGPLRSRILRMALDTGATYVMIPLDVAKVLGYDPSDRSHPRIDLTTASGTVKAPLITLERVGCLGVEVRKVEAVCHDLPAESTIDGLLGLSFLWHCDMDAHFKSWRLELRGP